MLCLCPDGAVDALEARPHKDTLLLLYNFSSETEVRILILIPDPPQCFPGELPLGVTHVVH